MPVAIENVAEFPVVANLRDRRTRRGSLRDRGKRLRVGLVNNMPDSAVEATRRQFARLIDDSAGDFDVRLSLWTLETLPRDDAARNDIAAKYGPARSLRGSGVDALIVTGAEPRAADLRDEPYWRELTNLFDWAEARTHSSVFSCLAAHAAVRHRDGIGRRRLAEKCSGVFATRVVAPHELVRGFRLGSATPHSRWNTLQESDLAAKGYRVLTRANEAGVDVFIREARALMVYLHGHPEYEADTLAREFRRDAQRFLRGEIPAPPSIPAHYYAPDREGRLRDYLASGQGPANFPAEALDMLHAPWRGASLTLFRNWLALLARRKSAAEGASAPIARWGG